MSGQAFVLTIIFFAVGLPVALGIGSDLFKRWLKHQEKKLEHEAAQTSRLVAAQRAQIERLEQRVRVLERIATDSGVTLAAEIHALQERPLKEIEKQN